jgi:hypothetical protein
MGHERIGVLPRTRKWSAIVERIATDAGSNEKVAGIASSVLQNVRGRFLRLHGDAGVQAAFGFLLALSLGEKQPGRNSRKIPEVDLESNPSPLMLSRELQAWVNSHRQSPEYASLAVAAANDTIARWTSRQTEQGNLFTSELSASEIWKTASTAGGFCELAREFLARLTERYLNYYLEREASAQTSTIADRDRFAASVTAHVDLVANHAFETAKIAQSFAAGWYTRNVIDRPATDTQLRKFLVRAFCKVQEEFLREQNG